MNKITTLQALRALQDETMVYAAIVGGIALAIAILVTSLVAYQGGNDKSYIIRRILFSVIGFISAASFYVYNDLIVKPSITKVGWQSMFSKTNMYCIAIVLGVYLVVGIILMFVFRHKKFGSILGKKRNS